MGAVFFDGKPGLFDVPPDFTHFLRDLTRELGMIMVMDEVVSIRAGHGGYQGSVGVEPDLTYFGKIVGGGFPVGAIGGRADLMDILDSTESNKGLRQSGTFSGNNFTLAAGLATLRALTPEVLDHLDGLRARLHAGMEEVFSRAGVPCQVLSSGSIVSFHLTDQPIRDFRSALSSDKDLFGRITLALLIKGQFTQQGLGFSLSRPMGTEEIDGVLSAIEETLAE
jgi:glutamate-1-semialdehyde 2,1-aminomutase